MANLITHRIYDFLPPTMTPTLHTLANLLNPWRTIRRLEAENRYLRQDLATARESVRRLVRYNLESYDSATVRGVYLWATFNGMAGPLPPLPEHLAKREQTRGGL